MHYCSFEKWNFVSFCSVSVVSILDWLEAIVSLLIKLSLLKWYMLLSTVRRKPVTEKQLCWSQLILCPTKPMLKGSISTMQTANFFQIRIGNLKAINKVHVLLIVPRIKMWIEISNSYFTGLATFIISLSRIWKYLVKLFRQWHFTIFWQFWTKGTIVWYSGRCYVICRHTSVLLYATEWIQPPLASYENCSRDQHHGPWGYS